MNKKEVGIITIQSDNFGNRLQNYAVQEILKKRSCTPVTFGRSYYYNDKHKKKIKIANIIHSIDWLVNISFAPEKIRKGLSGAAHIYNMNQFTKNNITMSDVYAENITKDIVDEFDYFLCGSDQLWNLKFPMVTETDFLQFADEKKNISIAASLGVEELTVDEQQMFTEYLRKFKGISVRENKAKEILQPLTEKDITVLPDPTMMLSADEWKKIEKKVKTPEKYIAVYLLDYASRNMVMDALNKFYDNKIPKIIWILDKIHPDNYWYGPSEFLYIIHHADAVYTDSFHGTVFSLLFERNVRIFERKHKGFSMNSRIYTLVDNLGINPSVIIREADDIMKDSTIDYEVVKKRINTEREKCNRFLNKYME